MSSRIIGSLFDTSGSRSALFEIIVGNCLAILICSSLSNAISLQTDTFNSMFPITVAILLHLRGVTRRNTYIGLAVVILELSFVIGVLDMKLVFESACMYCLLWLQQMVMFDTADLVLISIITKCSTETLFYRLLPSDIRDDEDAYMLSSFQCISCGIHFMLLLPFLWKHLTQYCERISLPNAVILLLQSLLSMVAIVCLRFQLMWRISAYSPEPVDPFIWVLKFLLMDGRKCLWLCVFWLGCIVIVIPATNWLDNLQFPQICIRKVFHLLVVAMFCPPLLNRSLLSFIVLAMGVALCCLLLIECLRSNSCENIRKLFPFTADILTYFQKFVDRRDCNRAIVLSHIYLLLACALPVWCWGLLLQCFGDCSSVNYLSSKQLVSLLPHVGCVTVGLGDAAAAVIGSQFGTHKWKNSSKTIEGTVSAFMIVAAVFLELFYLIHGQLSVSNMTDILLVSAIAAIVETFTTWNDNLMLPLYTGVSILLLSLYH